MKLVHAFDGEISLLSGKQNGDSVVLDENRFNYLGVLEAKSIVAYPEGIQRQHLVHSETVVETGSTLEVT